MKFATVRLTDGDRVCLVSEDGEAVRPLALSGVETMLDLIALGDPAPLLGDADGGWQALPAGALLAPIPRPRRNIWCVGKNYAEHAREFAESGFDQTSAGAPPVPDAPIVFSKVPDCVVGPGADVRYPAGVSELVDYEAELAVVIGKGGRGIAKADAMSHVWGYTIVNDVTARDLQHRHKQWLLGKSLDTFCPMGPWLVTADEVDVDDLDVKCWINGELRQDANTRDLIFDIPTLIATISAGVTLFPGDVIATGTPAGVGIGFDPPKALRPGDEMAVEISGLGRLVNHIA